MVSRLSCREKQNRAQVSIGIPRLAKVYFIYHFIYIVLAGKHAPFLSFDTHSGNVRAYCVSCCLLANIISSSWIILNSDYSAAPLSASSWDTICRSFTSAESKSGLLGKRRNRLQLHNLSAVLAQFLAFRWTQGHERIETYEAVQDEYITVKMLHSVSEYDREFEFIQIHKQ